MTDLAKEPTTGEERQFPDGGTRKFIKTSHGVGRWVSTGKGGGEDSGAGGQASAGQAPPIPPIEEEPPLQMINREEWIEYNKYLTIDNPYLYITNYEEGISIWLSKVYEYDNRGAIYRGEQRLYDVPRDKELDALEELYVLNNNQFLALQMYKMCALIQEISKYDHSFDYETMLDQGASWKDFVDYLEKAKEDE